MRLAVGLHEARDVGVAAGRRVEQQPAHVAGRQLEVRGAVETGVLGGRGDGLVLDLQAVDARRPPGEQEAQAADAAVQVVGALPGLRPGSAQHGLVEHGAHLRVGLQERRGRHAQPHAGELLVKAGRAHDHERTDAHRGVGARLVDGDGERGAGLLGGDALGQLALLWEPPGDEQVEQQLAGGQAAAHDEVAQQAGVVGRRVGRQAKGAAGGQDRLPRPRYLDRREVAVGHVDDVAPRTAAVHSQDRLAAVAPERVLHLVAVAPGVGHAQDGRDVDVVEAADVGQRLDHLAMLELELGGVVEGLPLAAADVGRVVAAKRHPARRRDEQLGEARLGVARPAARHLDARDVAGQPAAHEHHEALDAADPLAAVSEGVDGKLEGVAGLRGHGGQCTADARRDCPPARRSPLAISRPRSGRVPPQAGL